MHNWAAVSGASARNQNAVCVKKTIGGGPLALLYLLAQLLAGSPSNVVRKEVCSQFASQDFDRKEH